MKKQPNPIDRHVGGRVRMRRMMIGISQEKLGNELKLTFQQVQKYEKGANRIGASRLAHIASILNVPISFFYEGAPGVQATSKGAAPVNDPCATLVTTRDGLALAAAFNAIADSKERAAIVAIAQALATPVVTRTKAAA